MSSALHSGKQLFYYYRAVCLQMSWVWFDEWSSWSGSQSLAFWLRVFLSRIPACVGSVLIRSALMPHVSSGAQSIVALRASERKIKDPTHRFWQSLSLSSKSCVFCWTFEALHILPLQSPQNGTWTNQKCQSRNLKHHYLASFKHIFSFRMSLLEVCV